MYGARQDRGIKVLMRTKAFSSILITCKPRRSTQKLVGLLQGTQMQGWEVIKCYGWIVRVTGQKVTSEKLIKTMNGWQLNNVCGAFPSYRPSPMYAARATWVLGVWGVAEVTSQVAVNGRRQKKGKHCCNRPKQQRIRNNNNFGKQLSDSPCLPVGPSRSVLIARSVSANSPR
jgi:hypothetical protein